MNNARRTQLSAIARKLADLKAEMESLSGDIGTIRDEEQNAYDNLPESLQQGDKGEAMQDAITSMENAISCAEDGNADDAIDALEEIDGVSSAEG